MNTKNLGQSSEDLQFDIEIFNLTKHYKLKGRNKKVIALDNVDLKVRHGEIFGLLGPNGAGKTTMVSILTTLISPTSGYATILGNNVLHQQRKIKQNIGLMLGSEMIYRRLTGYKNLKFFSKIYGIKDYKLKITDITRQLGLENWLNQYVEKYSSGMKTKLALARTLLTDPKILFLDEPLLGIDPVTIEEIIEILLNLQKTIFITSHQMKIVDNLCDRIAFLKEGHIIKVDTQENFKKSITDIINIHVKLTQKKDKLIEKLNNLKFIRNLISHEDVVEFELESEIFYPILLDTLKDFPVIEFNESRPTLDDVFIKFSK